MSLESEIKFPLCVYLHIFGSIRSAFKPPPFAMFWFQEWRELEGAGGGQQINRKFYWRRNSASPN